MFDNRLDSWMPNSRSASVNPDATHIAQGKDIQTKPQKTKQNKNRYNSKDFKTIFARAILQGFDSSSTANMRGEITKQYIVLTELDCHSGFGC